MGAACRKNYEDAMEKMQKAIDAAAKPPNGPSDKTIQKIEKLAKKANGKRLEAKKQQSDKKKTRRDKNYD